MTQPASPCSDLLPSELTAPVAGATLPVTDQVGEWVAFADAQTGQLEKANGHTGAVVTIMKRCEERDRLIAERLKPRPWWRFWG